ncbi:MAG TPA: sodium ion-translocating decarboxylase subunit beta [Phycisphaerae bacterium]|nr:sodium ion-translocating decarboxylase subunit beta [Phycisphaerae bacterium]
MLGVGCVLLFLAIRKGFEPLLLIPIGFGCILSNIPLAGITDCTPPATEYNYFLAQEYSKMDNAKIVAIADNADPNNNLLASIEKEYINHMVARAEGEQAKAAAKKTPTVSEKAGKMVINPDFASYLRTQKSVAVAAFNSFYAAKAAAAGEKFKPYQETDGFLTIIYETGVATGLFPLIIFMGVGAMTDFGPLLANPKTALLGGAAQLGIFTTLFGALMLGFDINQASAIGIIGGADGPTSIFVARKLAPDLLGAIAVAAYSYMALVPIIQPPIMRLLTTKKQRAIKMEQLRHVSKLEKILFPLVVLGLCAVLLPSACPLIGALMFGNLAKESGVVERLSTTMANALINIVTIFLGLSVGMKLAADKFLNLQTIYILVLGLIAFSFGTAGGVIMAHIMNMFSKNKINPLIGAAGVSAVPMAARVCNKVGQEEDPHNFLLMHAMGPNVAGVIGSAVAAGVLLALCK